MEPGSEGFEEIEGGDGTTWRFDRAFLRSNWTCIWGRGCLGILAEAAPELNQGCCSVGAHIDGPDEAGSLVTLAALVEPERFQFHVEAEAGGVFSDDRSTNTRLVDDACIFLNRPGFSGGEGCALHLQAVADGERPIDWKPSVCWQLPVRVDWSARSVEAGPDAETATVRAWTRADWGEDGDPMHWCCTQGDRAYVGDHEVIDSLAEELTELVGTEVYVELRRRLS